MYSKETVKIPDVPGKVTTRSSGGSTYVNFEYGRVYDKARKFNVPKRVAIGRVSSDDASLMHPNERFAKFFPGASPDAETPPMRSSSVRVGAYAVIRQTAESLGLAAAASKCLGPERAGLFLDLAAYSIVTEGNAAQYYPDYCYDHPSLTEGMRVYSDSKVSSFLSEVTADERAEFLNIWNDLQGKDSIYISYDSTNKGSEAGDIDMVEFGNAKVDDGSPIINFSVAYDVNGSTPLFYEDYPGSVVDVAQLRHAIEKANAFGYGKIGFVLDRGYFSKGNIAFMDSKGYEFVMMVKGFKPLVSEEVLKARGSFEEKAASIPFYRCNGTTVEKDVYGDGKRRWLHIYYNYAKSSSERTLLEKRIDDIGRMLKSSEGKEIDLRTRETCRYFTLHYDGKTFLFARKDEAAVERAIKLCGYYSIITSKEMGAKEALELYKGRDASEKLFRSDKSYLGNSALRVYSTESAKAKILVEFAALIVRNRMFRMLSLEAQTSKRANYMTVPAAIRELEKIEIVRFNRSRYVLDHALTATQKAILKAFYIEEGEMREKAVAIGDELLGGEKK